MARSRVPKPYATIQLLLHACCLITSLITLILLIFLSVAIGKSYVWSYIAIVLPIIIDTCEIVALADYKHTIGRLQSGASLALEIVSMGFLTWSIFAILLDDWGKDRLTYVNKADPWRWYIWYCQIGVGSARFLFLILASVECCSCCKSCRRTETRRRNSMEL
ncbi:hypothetical protein ONS95_015042 [Cadophora gregata]|uniref:uncharacterized protein n=1 Tax=Cadophora gregata TaxID=51156 RepID=UPI0026DA86E3|nr:uncharacterized protein ONS95_015042 [Cadophora gregata]KAK0100679.1 hypothetical protein ONS95_015042 [Cadophora gregata]KAK0117323.1 hypothetical protein ONS96_013156 [Cadophora gregata f. sp. sojae]